MSQLILSRLHDTYILLSYFLQAAFLAMKSTGGKLLVFQSGKLTKYNCISFMACIRHPLKTQPVILCVLIIFDIAVLPSIGIGSLSAREAEGRSNMSAAGEKVLMLHLSALLGLIL